jgi:hypothetical protein
MKTFLFAVAALPLLTGVALATEPVKKQQPVQLTGQQMDKVTAGFTFTELTTSNTSAILVTVDVIPVPVLTGPGVFLSVISRNLSVQAAFRP